LILKLIRFNEVTESLECYKGSLANACPHSTVNSYSDIPMGISRLERRCNFILSLFYLSSKFSNKEPRGTEEREGRMKVLRAAVRNLRTVSRTWNCIEVRDRARNFSPRNGCVRRRCLP